MTVVKLIFFFVLCRYYIDQPAEVLCETCSDPYCEVCFAAQHRKGSRKKHIVKPLKKGVTVKSVEVNGEATNGEPVSVMSAQYSLILIYMKCLDER